MIIKLIWSVILTLLLWISPAEAFTIPTIPYVSVLPPCSGIGYNFFVDAGYLAIFKQREMTPLEAAGTLVSSCIPFSDKPIDFVVKDNPCTIAIAHKAFIEHAKSRNVEEKVFNIAKGSGYVVNVLPDQDYFNKAYGEAYRYCKFGKSVPKTSIISDIYKVVKTKYQYYGFRHSKLHPHK